MPVLSHKLAIEPIYLAAAGGTITGHVGCGTRKPARGSSHEPATTGLRAPRNRSDIRACQALYRSSRETVGARSYGRRTSLHWVNPTREQHPSTSPEQGNACNKVAIISSFMKQDGFPGISGISGTRLSAERSFAMRNDSACARHCMASVAGVARAHSVEKTSLGRGQTE